MSDVMKASWLRWPWLGARRIVERKEDGLCMRGVDDVGAEKSSLGLWVYPHFWSSMARSKFTKSYLYALISYQTSQIL
jgi:hypothetical protein